MSRVGAYAAVVVLAAGGLWQAREAQSLARDVDHRGDIRACQQENHIRAEANERNAKLEQTARTTAEALEILSKVDRPANGTDTESKLRKLAEKARSIQTEFKPAVIVDCKEIFPGP